MDHSTRLGGQRFRWLKGFGPLAAAGSRHQHLFHGADGADALQGIGQQWPSGDVLDLSLEYRKFRQPRKLLPRLGPALRVCAYRRR
jgi:hypothetical protein